MNVIPSNAGPSNTIPLQRLLFYVLIISVAPLLFVCFSLWSSFEVCDALQGRLEQKIIETRQVAPLFDRLQQIEQTHQGRDSAYINKHLETFIPLAVEIDLLKARATRGFLPDEEAQRRRLESLTSGQNSFTFVEGAQQVGRGVSGALWKETVETQTKPVELSGEDVAEVISRVEGNHALGQSRPQLLFLDFRMERRKGAGGDYYQLTTKLLKREWKKRELVQPQPNSVGGAS